MLKWRETDSSKKNGGMRQIAINPGVTFYFDGHTCYDIDVDPDVTEITFTGIATNDPVFAKRNPEGLPRCTYCLQKVKKQFPNVKRIRLLKDIEFYMNPIRISNFMFPNVRQVISLSDRFANRKTLQMRTGRGNVLLNSFCIKENENLDLEGVSEIRPYALEGCITAKVINANELNKIWPTALKGTFFDMQNSADAILFDDILVKSPIDENGVAKVPKSTKRIAKNIDFEQVKTLEICNPDLLNIKCKHIFEKIVLKTEEKKILDTDSVMFSLTQNIEVSDKNPYYKTVDGILYSKNGKTLLKCPNHRTEDVAIPDGVERIAPYAFESCRFQSVSMPDTLKQIGKLAFLSCQNLKHVDLGNGITRLGSEQTKDTGIFDSCKNLHSITFPKQLKVIGAGAFKNSGLQEVQLNDGLEVIEYNAFENLNCNIDTLKFPASIQYVGIHNLAHVKTVDISDGIPLNFIQAAATTCNHMGYIKIINQSYETLLPRDIKMNTADFIQQMIEFNSSNIEFMDGLFLFASSETDKKAMAIELYKEYKNNCAKEYISQNFMEMAETQIKDGAGKTLSELLNFRIATKEQLMELLKITQEKNDTQATAEILDKLR